jgi:hypothetical protein
MKKLLIFVFFYSLLYSQNTIIGKFERVSFKEFGLNNLKAKIDSGAKTSSLHCSFIHKLPNNKVSFILLDKDHKKFTSLSKTATISRIGKVKSSNGKIQKRYFIKTTISLLGKEFLTEFSLTNRGSMKFPVLLGRSLLKNGFCIDVNKQYSHLDNK